MKKHPAGLLVAIRLLCMAMAVPVTHWVRATVNVRKHPAARYILGATIVVMVSASPASAQSFQGFVNMANLFWAAITALLGVVCMVSWISALGQYLSRGEQLGGYFWTAIGLAVGSTFLLGVEAIVSALSSGAGGGATGTI